MTSRPESFRARRPMNQAQVMASLQACGLSMSGIQQALQGNIVADPSDRATIASILAAFASLPAHAKAEVYDYPGEYAQRFDGVDTGGCARGPVRHPVKR
jgi:hypothetical protein